jgi:hypothetical protein
MVFCLTLDVGQIDALDYIPSIIDPCVTKTKLAAK